MVEVLNILELYCQTLATRQAMIEASKFIYNFLNSILILKNSQKFKKHMPSRSASGSM